MTPLGAHQTARAAAIPLGEDGTRLQEALRLASRMLGEARALAESLDFSDLELPSVGTTPADQARLRSVAPLYLASELESARLLPALEMFAGLWTSGGIAADLGALSAPLISFHRSRNARLTGPEREALFGRLFGKSYGPGLAVEDSRNVAFDSLMIELAAALSDWHASASKGTARGADLTRVLIAAQQLAANLSLRGGGMADFASGEILRDIKLAIDVFKATAVQRILGSRSPWDAVDTVIRRFLQQDVDVISHVERARTGITLLGWVADALPSLETGALEPPPDETVAHAIRWMQATLALHERGQVDRTQAGWG